MGHMSKKRMSFPMEVQTGSVVVKIYRVRKKACRVTAKDNSTEENERFSFMVSFFADGKRRQKMFADFEEAHAEAKLKASKLAAGQLDAVEMSNKESSIYAHATEAVKPAVADTNSTKRPRMNADELDGTERPFSSAVRVLQRDRQKTSASAIACWSVGSLVAVTVPATRTWGEWCRIEGRWSAEIVDDIAGIRHR